MKPKLLKNGNVIVPVGDKLVELTWEQFTDRGGTEMDLQVDFEELKALAS